ncbi:von Willebrand factor type A domain-containing protein [Parafrankia irregularis]|uniref:von Willebrand factor type A domain-containing protein n=2 Tax=Parafrankia irregularis TaxID=795642 RepID=A0A0S4QNH0_9ACTN|nr:VWA domain-containing protein [Parafrankia sp. CH37]MBE3200169.1 VWA domain-containing protein [Parafrankia sp. CH37]CUU56639.1 von Willebrand factor type A domain-containing protein [Parafrankia irregularis]
MDDEGLGGLSLLASAMAGRAVRVAAADGDEPAWTDGVTVFVDPAAGRRRQLETLAVQASLLASGSLEPGLLRELSRRSALARRYLLVEGHRALAANEDLLPPGLRSLIDRDVAALAGSAAGSLAAARSGLATGDPPKSFGTIDARRLLAARARAGSAVPAASVQGIAARRTGSRRDLAELPGEDGPSVVLDLLASPVGGGGAVGRLLARMFAAARSSGGDGPTGADPVTHRSRAGIRAGRTVTIGSASPDPVVGMPEARGQGWRYPEWDVHAGRYRPDWCTVREVMSPLGRAPVALPAGHALRRPLARLGVGLDRSPRQRQGDDLDVDALVEARVTTLAGLACDEAVYVDRLRRRRDLSVLVLLDCSGSVAEPAVSGGTVHEHQRTAAAALVTALHDLGDRVALYAFRSQGRSAVHLEPVKRFDDRLGTVALRRLGGLVPGGYTRLGAAIRHGVSVLSDHGGTSRRLLVVLSDGLAYDHGYERSYGEADARRALAQARRRGVGAVCLSVGTSTDAAALREVFGAAAHGSIPRSDQLSQVVGPLFRTALRGAEARRRGP